MAKHPHQSSHKSGDAIGNKIRKLKEEGKTHNQAIGQAMGMARQGSLGSAAKASVGEKPRKKFANPNAEHFWPETDLRGANPQKY